MTESGGERRRKVDPISNPGSSTRALEASGSSTLKDLPQEAFVAAHSIWKTN